MSILFATPLRWAGQVRAWASTVPPDDQLGPVDQDADAVREEACKLVSSNQRVCAPPRPIEVEPPRRSGGGGGAFDFVSLLLWVLLFAAVVGLLALLVHWAMSAQGPIGRRRPAKSDADDDADADIVEANVVAVDRSREPVNWRAEADEHRRAGRYRDALRCRYRALVGDLARKGLIDEIPGRTTGEERMQLRVVAPDAAPAFNAAANLFDGAWYGNVPVDERDDDRFLAIEHDVLARSAGPRR